MLRTRIILVDDHRILLDALKSLVEPEFEVAAIFEDCQTLLEQAVELRPDIVVLDIGMPMINGLAAGEQLKKLLPKTKLIFLTMNHDKDTAAEAFQLGASGYVVKTSAGTELIKALREVIRGGYFASEVLTEGMVGSFVQAFKKMKSSNTLTLRQKEVLQLLAEGLSMKEAALVLKITPRTVAFHKYSMMERLNIKSNAELMAFASSTLPVIE
ncbi:MAG TPA: response regulator transcription factor [Pyrinomonadaceae bacterium]|nr:response regulator transcription factor [Pyrinomonadaceae bacterium]